MRTSIRRQPLDEFLGFLSSVNFGKSRASDLFQNSPELLTANRIFIPLLAKYAIINSNDHCGQSDRDVVKVVREITESIKSIIEIKDWIPNVIADSPERALEAWSFIVTNQQNPFQEDPKNTFARCLILFDQLPNEIPDENVNIPNAIEELYDLSLNQLFVTTAHIIGKYNGGYQVFNNKNSDDISLVYFKNFSIDHSKFRNIADDSRLSLKGISTQFFGYSPLDNYPIVSTKRGYV